MSEEQNPYYGQAQQDGYPLADRIYGHRLIAGQGWMEYLLEFLNVLVGFEYRLGDGTDGTVERSVSEGYIRRPRLGLRRFVFYDESESRSDIKDDLALRYLTDALKDRAVGGSNPSERETNLRVARELLQSYTAVEAARSWYAKSLFPVHEEVLFWEAYRKKTPKSYSYDDQDSLAELDTGLGVGARNFFARGGEVYYLMLSAGTKDEPALRTTIQDNIRRLLTDSNPAIGRLARVIDATWQDLRQGAGNGGETEMETANNVEIGWIPFPDSYLYKGMANDVATLLDAERDPLESLDLLAHLICFHLVIYIYWRTNMPTEQHLGSLMLPVDCMGGHRAFLRRISGARFGDQQQLQLANAKKYVRQMVSEWETEVARDKDFVGNLVDLAERYFDVGTLHQTSRSSSNKGSKKLTPRERYARRLAELEVELDGGELSRSDFAEHYAETLTELLRDRFVKVFLPVHSKLARNIGFVAPFRAPSKRFVLGDNLLKALVISNVPTGQSMRYDRFLDLLYRRYGIIVGQREARDSGLYNRVPINAEYYNENLAALKDKLKAASLLEEYSDATAMVKNS